VSDTELWEIVQLVQVSLASLSVHSTLKPEELPATAPRLVLEVDASASCPSEHPQVEVLVSLRVVAETPDQETPAFSIDGTYRVLYRVPVEARPSDDALQAFAAANGVFNVWPYWRELTHSLYGRMELPFPPIPLYRTANGIDASPIEEPSR